MTAEDIFRRVAQTGFDVLREQIFGHGHGIYDYDIPQPRPRARPRHPYTPVLCPDCGVPIYPISSNVYICARCIARFVIGEQSTPGYPLGVEASPPPPPRSPRMAESFPFFFSGPTTRYQSSPEPPRPRPRRRPPASETRRPKRKSSSVPPSHPKSRIDPELVKASSTLGIDPRTSLPAAKILHRKLVMQHHPDHGGNLGRMQEINDAFDVFVVEHTNYYHHGNPCTCP